MITTMSTTRKLLITGGAGFIGSALVRHVIRATPYHVLNLDKLTYAGSLASVASVNEHPRYQFVQADITDANALTQILQHYRPDAIMHLAAETHVDRSLAGPSQFIHTNIVGTYTLLEACREYWQQLPSTAQQDFRFHHVSTDEVYGDLCDSKALFLETSPYAPSSPYSASKASADHLVRAWHRSYGLPVVISTCSNNYGPYQFPEKLIPHMVLSALAGQALPIYGSGLQIRDWLYVEDHAQALLQVMERGQTGHTYNIGGKSEKRNLDVVHTLCQLLEELAPHKPAGVQYYSDLIQFVDDRAGHDQRYAVDTQKIEAELGWTPTTSFDSGLRHTLQWYLDQQHWWQTILDHRYRLERPGHPTA